MQKRTTFFPIFLTFFILSLLILFLARSGLSGFLETATLPVQRLVFDMFHPGKQSAEDKLRSENRDLLTRLAKEQELIKENKALRDQFETTNQAPAKLLPAEVVGMHDNSIIIDKGSTDNIKVGSVIIYKDNLLGQVVKVTDHLSTINLIIQEGTSFTAQTAKTSANGVINGGSGGIILNTVVLSDNLEKDDLVVTKGAIDSSGKGFPPGLVVGKIISISKHASALFQSAEVRSLIDFAQLRIVFVMM